MAVFPQAECLSFIKNDTQIPNLYVSSNNFGEKKNPEFLSVKVVQGEVSKRPGNVFYS